VETQSRARLLNDRGGYEIAEAARSRNNEV
jgi:hypothetical protein